MHPTIIIESNIPFIHGLLDAYANVRYLSPEDITPTTMYDAHALITRTRTRCDHNLLEQSSCQIIASATIGLDHIDVPYCQSRGIEVYNAPGCNAPAVAQYVMTSIIAAYGSSLSGLTLGIVGVGHVGSIVQSWATNLGMIVLPCDPPRALAEDDSGFVTMDEIAKRADIITFHTPYTRTDQWATHHLCNESFLAQTQRHPMIINSARGSIVDTQALNRALINGIISKVVIDCWENEPNIDPTLLSNAFIATPHIAGYSRQGKIRATAMAATAIAHKFGFPTPVMPEQVPIQAPEAVTIQALQQSYNPLSDTEALRHNPLAFESLRNHYALREEVC